MSLEIESFMRLDKFLTQMQVGSRSEVKNMIKKGIVLVNGEVCQKADSKIDENTDRICVNGKEIIYQEYYYYIFHKPAGIVTATQDNHDKTVMDYFKNVPGKNMFPVGRLDKDTEGLLLVTNDGELAHNLLSPKKHVEKTYYVECTGVFREDTLKRLEDGVDIGEDTLTLPAKAVLCKQDTQGYTILLTITEGKFHQVKRMIHAVGGEVTYLKRISFGPLTLDDNLDKGCLRVLTPKEQKSLFNR